MESVAYSIVKNTMKFFVGPKYMYIHIQTNTVLLLRYIYKICMYIICNSIHHFHPFSMSKITFATRVALFGSDKVVTLESTSVLGSALASWEHDRLFLKAFSAMKMILLVEEIPNNHLGMYKTM